MGQAALEAVAQLPEGQQDLIPSGTNGFPKISKHLGCPGF